MWSHLFAQQQLQIMDAKRLCGSLMAMLITTRSSSSSGGEMQCSPFNFSGPKPCLQLDMALVHLLYVQTLLVRNALTWWVDPERRSFKGLFLHPTTAAAKTLDLHLWSDSDLCGASPCLLATLGLSHFFSDHTGSILWPAHIRARLLKKKMGFPCAIQCSEAW